MTKTFDSCGAQMARLFRETADLIERGLVMVDSIAIRCEHLRSASIDGRMYDVPTGERIVHLELRGYDFAMWEGAAHADVNRSLPRGASQLGHDTRRLPAPNTEEST